MKKILLPLLLILAVGMLAAVESEPSEIVGYFKKTINEGFYQSLCLPFAYTSLNVNDVIGDQFNEGDRFLDINSGYSTTFYDGYGWDGPLAEFSYGSAYYVNRVSPNGQKTYYILGKVDPQGFTKTINGNGYFTAFGLNEASPITIIAENSPFGTLPSDGDRIIEIDTGLSTTYYDGYGWDGGLQEISPTMGYYYNSVVGSSSFVWTYSPTRSSNIQKILSGSKTK
jgi:hypothetical protein